MTGVRVVAFFDTTISQPNTRRTADLSSGLHSNRSCNGTRGTWRSAMYLVRCSAAAVHIPKITDQSIFLKATPNRQPHLIGVYAWRSMRQNAHLDLDR